MFFDFFQSLALVFENQEEDLLLRKPRSKQDHLANVSLLIKGFVYMGSYQAFFSLLNFFLYMKIEARLDLSDLFFLYNTYKTGVGPLTLDQYNKFLSGAQTASFISCVIMQAFGNLYANRTRTLSLLKSSPLSKKYFNPWLFVVTTLSVVILLANIYVPFFQDAFNLQPVPVYYYFLSFVYAFGIIAMDELRKLGNRSGLFARCLASFRFVRT
jgi:sodium/potassium-transporting ATPase subunit alpha